MAQRVSSSMKAAIYRYIEALGSDLLAKGLQFESRPLPATNALDFDAEWRKFRVNIEKLTGCDIKLAADHAWDMLKVTMTSPYNHENDFSSALLGVLENILADAMDNTQKDTGVQLPLQNARVSSNEEKLFFGFSASMLPNDIAGDCSLQADHTCCILDSQKKPAALAVVEFKTYETTCKLNEMNFGIMDRPKLDDAHSGGPIAQVLVRCLRQVLPVLVENGIHPVSIPWLVLACNESSNADVTTSPKRAKSVRPCRFVFGYLSFPKQCGEMPTYCIQEIGHFDDTSSAKLGMAAYLRVMNFGLEKIFICRALKMKTDSIVSGEHMYIGTTKVDNIKVNHHIQISQGELVSGEVNWQSVQEFAKTNQDAIVLDHSLQVPDEPISILCMISCPIFHDVVIDPIDALHAMTSVFGKLSDDKVPYVFDVLLAVYAPTKYSLITVMRDLSQAGYTSFEPKQIENKLTLWKMFMELIKKDLLPLAEHCTNVICSNLQIGWDKTHNILYHYQEEELRLIDFENRTKRIDFPPQPNTFHVDYDGLDYSRSRMKFVWWQIVLVAYCWSNEVDCDNFSAKETVHLLRKGITVESWSELEKLDGSTLTQLQSIVQKEPIDVSSTDVTNTLCWLGNLFRAESEIENVDSNHNCKLVRN